MMTLTDDQARAFLSLAEMTRYGALYKLALHTGMRQGELLGLKWADLDWVNKRLQVKRQVQRIPGKGLSFTEPKSAAGRRVITLGKNMVERLRNHYNEQILIQKNAGEKWQENDLMFPTKLGTPMHPTSMYKDFKALLSENDLPDIRFHDLRHTAATLMLQQGIHPKVVQERLGHADIALTLNTYSHVLPTMQEDAAEKLEEILTSIDVTTRIKDMTSQYEVLSYEDFVQRPD
jgi:integrase